MKVLIVEDDRNKLDQVLKHVSLSCGELVADVELVARRSYQSGLKACIQWKPDLAIMDMTMPTFDIAHDESGGRPRHFGGMDILRELNRREIVIPTIIVTGFDVIGEGAEQRTRANLSNELQKNYPKAYRGTVFYTTSESNWKGELAGLIRKVAGELYGFGVDS